MAADVEALVATWKEERVVALKSRLVTHDARPFVPGGANNDPAAVFDGKVLALVGGVDVSYVSPAKQSAVTESSTAAAATKTDDGAACLAVLAFPSLECVYVDVEPVSTSAPYVPGCLASRELPPLVKLLQRCPRAVVPSVVFVDGNGVLHPDGFGLASHLGVVAGVPTIGVGKNLLHVDGLSTKETRAACDAAVSTCVDGENDDVWGRDARGRAALPLVGESGTVWGAAVYGHRLGPIGGGRGSGTGCGGEADIGAVKKSLGSAGKPVYVSVGHGLSLATAVALTKACSRSRVPEPVRIADMKSREYIREVLEVSNQPR